VALLKNEWAIRAVILLAGIGLGFKLFNKPKADVPVVQQAQQQKQSADQNCTAKVIRVTSPDGSVKESVEIGSTQSASSTSSQDMSVARSESNKPDNVSALTDLKEHQIVIKPFDNIPVVASGEYNHQTGEYRFKVGLPFRINL